MREADPSFAERAVLGMLLIDAAAWAPVSNRLRPEHFSAVERRTVFGAIAELASAGNPHDIVTVSNLLRRGGKLDAVGGIALLASMARETPSAVQIIAYADAVLDHAKLRMLTDAGSWITRLAVEDGGVCSADDLISQSIDRLVRLQLGERVGKGLVSAGDLMADLIADMEARKLAPQGVQVGLKDFDSFTGGLEHSELTLIAGRPGMGKSAVMVTLALNVARNRPVAVFSADMPSIQLMRRAVAFDGEIPQGHLRDVEQLRDSDWTTIVEVNQRMQQAKLWIDESPSPPVSHVRAECYRLKAQQHNIGLVMVDYLQLMQGAGSKRYEQLRDISYDLKALSADLRCPVIALAQLSRATEQREDKRPIMADLYESSGIEQAAANIAMLYRPYYYDKAYPVPQAMECNFVKVRNGDPGSCLWNFEGAYSRVTVMSQEDRERCPGLAGKPPPAKKDNSDMFGAAG